jgi:glycerol-3-phosphate dehydrogenase
VAELYSDPAAAAREKFDLIVIGGGIYGAMISLEASCRGLRALLLERGDFGQGTTRNSLRIVHGGLRYLQHLDLRRHRESVLERSWLLSTFPGLVEPLPCLMPLYSRGLRSPTGMRVALGIDALLTPKPPTADGRLPRGRRESREAIEQTCGAVRQPGLRGGVSWSDAFVPHLARLIPEILHRACKRGAVALNYVEATGARCENGRITGIEAIDHSSGTSHTYSAARVVNAAGPDSRDFARRVDRDHPKLFERTLAWNLLLDISLPDGRALAVTPPARGSQTYFLVPWEGRLLAGTGHSSFDDDGAQPRLSRTQLRAFLGQLDLAAPGLGICEEKLLRIYAGFLPGRRHGTAELSKRPVVLDHGEHGGPSGLFSISGVKLTTSRRVADTVLHRAFPGHTAGIVDDDTEAYRARLARTRFGPTWRPEDDGVWMRDLQHLISEESVKHLDDLILRRTSLGEDPRKARAVAEVVCDAFDWNPSRREAELERLDRSLDDALALQD